MTRGPIIPPHLISEYIIKNTIEIKFEEIKQQLGFYSLPEIDGDSKKTTIRKYEQFYREYLDRIKQLRIIDLSCGAGAFVVAAFDAIMAEASHVDKAMSQLGLPRLFIRWDKTILKDMLYGIDISPEAIEITKLSLWLKIASKKEPLISLDKHFVVGNSVVDIDYDEIFPKVMQNGGFDIVLGNPPYIRHELIKDDKDNLKGYKTYKGTADLYVYFYELGYDLLKEEGYLGYISSNKWMRARYGQNMRAFIKDKTTLTHLLDLTGKKIFHDATVDTNILIYKKKLPAENNHFYIKQEPFFQDASQMQQQHLNDDIFFTSRSKVNSP